MLDEAAKFRREFNVQKIEILENDDFRSDETKRKGLA